jgi:hypothetical protein
MPLRLRRGTDAERQTITPAEGELVYTTDFKKIYVGDGETIGGIDIVGGVSGDLIANVNLNGYAIEGPGNILITGNISSTNLLSNGLLTLTGTLVTSSSGFIAVGSGNSIGTIEFGSVANPLQLVQRWNEPVEPTSIQYGITNGFYSLISNKNSSRGTVSSPLIVQPGDALYIDQTFGYDGFDYVKSSSIWQGVDPSDTPGPGYVPGAIAFLTEGPTGQNVTAINSRGYLSINKFPAAATEALDVNGNAVVSGTVTAAAFKGIFFGDDSTAIIDSSTGNINGNIVFASGLVSTVLTLSNGAFIDGKISLRQASPSDNSIEQYGITNGPEALSNSKYTGRGTPSSLVTVQPGDVLSNEHVHGWDGSNFIRSSSIIHAVDILESVTTGSVPGSILFTTYGTGGPKASVIDSRGYLSINKFPSPTSEALDVNGNAAISGTVTSTFKGRFLADDPLALPLIDGAIGAIVANVVASGNIASNFNTVNQKLTLNQLVDAGSTILEELGTSTGNSGLKNTFSTARGTIVAPEVLTAGDCIASFESLGHDGTEFILSSKIWTGHDVNVPITTGYVPGTIKFYIANSLGGFHPASGFDSNGRFGILNDTDPAQAELDVRGNAVVSGTVTAAAFKGSVVADDSTLIIDGITGKIPYAVLEGAPTNLSEFVNDLGGESDPVFALSAAAGITSTDVSNWNTAYGWGDHSTAGYLTQVSGQITADINGSVFADDSTMVVDGLTGAVIGSTVTSTGYVMFGSYDSVGRAALTPANGMVIYNTTANRFQGYQAGGWINLDDGSAAP